MFPVQCYSPKSLPVPFPSPLRHVQEQCADLAPFPHHPLVPQPLHVAALHWNYPHQGRQSHWITKPLSSYVSLSSIQKTLWRAHHAPGGSPIPRLLPPLGGLGFSHTCTTAFPGSLALLWLLLQPYHNPPKEGSPGFCPWSLSSLFLVIFALLISKFTSANDPQIFISSDSICSKANPPSSIWNQTHTRFFYVSVHGILSTFQAWNLSITLDFHLAPQHSIP